jgi:hypothetical protein
VLGTPLYLAPYCTQTVRFNYPQSDYRTKVIIQYINDTSLGDPINKLTVISTNDILEIFELCIGYASKMSMIPSKKRYKVDTTIKISRAFIGWR